MYACMYVCTYVLTKKHIQTISYLNNFKAERTINQNVTSHVQEFWRTNSLIF